MLGLSGCMRSSQSALQSTVFNPPDFLRFTRLNSPIIGSAIDFDYEGCEPVPGHCF